MLGDFATGLGGIALASLMTRECSAAAVPGEAADPPPHHPPRAKKAIQIIEELTAVPEMGKTYLGKVQRIVDFGAFVEIIPGNEGLLHISQIAEERTRRVEDVLNEGDQVLVKVIEVDPSGKIRLSRRAALKDPEAEAVGPEQLTGRPGEGGPDDGAPAPRPDRDRGDRDRDRGGARGGDRGRGHRR